MRTDTEIKEAVRAAYAERAVNVAASCCGDSCGVSGPAPLLSLEPGVTLVTMPETAVSYGCGNPLAIEALRPGEVVLDLGSGAGYDCLLASQRVGPSGRVIGVDMTPEMIELARRNIAAAGAGNIEFRAGEIEALPVEDASVDVVISNCVLNLVPDKSAAFREAFRVLRPGGRLQVADVVLNRPLSQEERDDLDRWAGCTSGAIHRDEYAAGLRAAGFEGVNIEGPANTPEPWVSAHILALRPVR